ncbi:phosphotransferase [Variovorax sp. YR216]|uniref:phosphotransferase n=1 Tax=Variovorax sp. YR216 TaxID=1882828 RepID=UPI00089D4B6F|nr:phosphotransferase [Variovorax sp. YR216]SEB04712.1 Predicted kinase, aminoglycoside phosphotransferase (APT) family [Variovorax sp. YR216]
MSEPFSGTTDVQPAQRFDEERLRQWFTSHVDEDARGDFGIRQFRGGQSNPTFLVDAGRHRYVLRRKPSGELLPSAHAVDREFRIMKALARTEVPVPRVHALCEDDEVIGSAFYVMDYMDGRILWDPKLPDASREERSLICDDMNRVLAALHEVDVEAAGLADFGRTGNYIERQIARWTRQYRASETEHIEAFENLIAWLPQHVPAVAATRIVHGDFRLDNLVFARDSPRVIAVLDWELSTLGDPMADFAYHCMAWQLPPPFRGLGDLSGIQLARLGLPSVERHLARYCERRRLPAVTTAAWRFYGAFNLFRAAAIAQGIMGRALAGNASSAHALEAGRQARALAELGWRTTQD